MSRPNLSAYENGRRSPSPEVLDRIARDLRGRPSLRIQQHRNAIRALVTEHHATTPRFFGSVARGDDEAGSDVVAVGFDEFVTDIRTQWAVGMGLIRIGEPVNRIPVEVLGCCPDQP